MRAEQPQQSAAREWMHDEERGRRSLLSMARSQRDRAVLVRELLDLREVVHEEADGVRPLAEHKGQTLEVALALTTQDNHRDQRNGHRRADTEHAIVQIRPG